MTAAALSSATTANADSLLAPPVARKASGRRPAGAVAKGAAAAGADAAMFETLLAGHPTPARKAGPGVGKARVSEAGADPAVAAVPPMPALPQRDRPVLPGSAGQALPADLSAAPETAGALPERRSHGTASAAGPAHAEASADAALTVTPEPVDGAEPGEPSAAVAGTAPRPRQVTHAGRPAIEAGVDAVRAAGGALVLPAPAGTVPVPPTAAPEPSIGALAAVEARGGASIRRGTGRETVHPVAGTAGVASGDSARASADQRTAPGSLVPRSALAADAGPLNLVNVPFSFQNALSGNGGTAGESAGGAMAGPGGPMPAAAGDLASESFADIAIGVDPDAGMAVRLAAGSEAAAERLRGEVDILERALVAIGSDVEAIDVALRTSTAEDGRNRDDERPNAIGGDGQRGSGADAKGWGDNAGGSNSGGAERAGRAWPGLAAGAGAVGATGAASGGRAGIDGKVDRYG